MHIYSSCAWHQRPVAFLTAAAPPQLLPPLPVQLSGSAQLARCAVEVTSVRLGCGKPWLRAGLTGRRHYDSFTCPWPFCPGSGSGSNLDRYIPAVPSSSLLPNTFPFPPHTPVPSRVAKVTAPLKLFCERDLSLSAFASILIFRYFFC